ncbi:hypothetical protein FN846DRAFT_1023243 [Sphaerosporella brunnea]|uniref:peptidylprolyl isomerase n=1 Tax=Sphaerosporella brunnea TaxID=1250544 RepID=A0A5J5ERL1_9PEZI|nr:hypothetical protein FN846DRAFT_1023243 [Sphaerosporella brunnea]
MSLHHVAFFGLKVPAGDEPTILESPLPGMNMVRITMAAIDPTAKPLEADQPKIATLKLLRRPLEIDDYEDLSDDSDEESDDDEEESDDDEEEFKPSKKAADKAIKKALKIAEANAMEVDSDKKSDDKVDSDSGSDDDGEGDFETEEFVLCTLDPAKNYQQTLDFVVGEDEEVAFIVSGNFDVSLTGNWVSPAINKHEDREYRGGNPEEEDDFDESPDEDELMHILRAAEESEDGLDDEPNPRITEIDTDEEKPQPKRSKAEKKALKRASKEEAKPEEPKLSEAEKKGLKRAAKEEAKPEEPKLSEAEKQGLKRAAEEEAKPEEPKLSKKQLKKLKANDGKAIDAAAETSESKKKVQFAKPIEQGPTNGQKDTKKPADKAPKSSTGSTPRVIAGVTIEDKKIGTGPAAKAGSKLGLRYIGKLKNGKVFDSNTNGKPFTFRLGKGEVIKGWDIGLIGMKVGGERRMIIPASAAYGKQSLPGIPPNSELTFDVKLLEIK